MTDSLKLRTVSGWSILLLGVLLLITSFLPVVLRGAVSPAAGMIGLFGLLAAGVGGTLSMVAGRRLTAGAARMVCVVLESLMLGAAGGVCGLLAQRSSVFDIRDPLHATLVIVLVALVCFAALARVATARRASEAFLAPSESLFSLGGGIDPVTFLVLQPALLVFAGVVGRMIVAAAGDGREGALLALALLLAVLPVFARVEFALCVRRRRDTTAAWPSYGVLAWAALLGLITFPEIVQRAVRLPGGLLSSSPPLAWSHIPLARVLCYLAALAACVSFYLASRQGRRPFFSRGLGYVALGIGTLLPVSVGLATGDAHQGAAIPIAIVLAVAIVLPAVLIIGAHHLLFIRDAMPAAVQPETSGLDVTSPAQDEPVAASALALDTLQQTPEGGEEIIRLKSAGAVQSLEPKV